MKNFKPTMQEWSCFNTASGMDCMQYHLFDNEPTTRGKGVSIPQAVWIACNGEILVADFAMNGFNTASGMDCMQSSERTSWSQMYWFQYRKRYGLHAI